MAETSRLLVPSFRFFIFVSSYDVGLLQLAFGREGTDYWLFTFR
jgi:hypothetical protein